MLDMTVSYVGNILNTEPQTWHDKYIALIALASCIEGPNPAMLLNSLQSNDMAMYNWIISNGQEPSERVRCATGNLVCLLA
jgi:hypothetical protein